MPVLQLPPRGDELAQDGYHRLGGECVIGGGDPSQLPSRTLTDPEWNNTSVLAGEAPPFQAVAPPALRGIGPKLAR